MEKKKYSSKKIIKYKSYSGQQNIPDQYSQQIFQANIASKYSCPTCVTLIQKHNEQGNSKKQVILLFNMLKIVPSLEYRILCMLPNCQTGLCIETKIHNTNNSHSQIDTFNCSEREHFHITPTQRPIHQVESCPNMRVRLAVCLSVVYMYLLYPCICG